MNFCVRMMSFVALLGTTLIGLGQYRPAWAARAGLDWWNLPELCEEVRRGERELAEKEAPGRVMVERLRARGEVIDDLRAGRLTLVQAAARFRSLNALSPESPTDLRLLAGATAEERLCRQVIFWAEGAEHAGSPTAGEQTCRHLEAELDRLLAENNGIIRLPE